MRLVAAAVVVVAAAAPAFAQQRHWIDPGKSDTFSVCIEERCLEPAWPVASLRVTITGYDSDWLVVELSCRHTSSNEDRLMARGQGWEHVEIRTQFAPEYHRWCNIRVSNLVEERQSYSVRVDAIAEPEWASLWPGNKRTGEYERWTRRDPPGDDTDANDRDDPRFDDRFWRQLVYNQHDEPDSLFGRVSRVLTGALGVTEMDMLIVTTDESGREVLPRATTDMMRQRAVEIGRLLTGRDFIRRVVVSSSNPGERFGWILVTPDTDEVEEGVCGVAKIGAPAGRIWLRVTDDQRCFGMEIFAHEVGHALGFHHVSNEAYPASVMNTPVTESRFTENEVHHARLAYEAGRAAPYCGHPQSDSCPTRGTLGGPQLELLGPPPIVVD